MRLKERQRVALGCFKRRSPASALEKRGESLVLWEVLDDELREVCDNILGKIESLAVDCVIRGKHGEQ